MKKRDVLLFALTILFLVLVFNKAFSVYQDWFTRDYTRDKWLCESAWNCDDVFHVEKTKSLLGLNYSDTWPDNYLENYPAYPHVLTALYYTVVVQDVRIALMLASITIFLALSFLSAYLVYLFTGRTLLSVLSLFVFHFSPMSTLILAVSTLSRGVLVIGFLLMLALYYKQRVKLLLLATLFTMTSHSLALPFALYAFTSLLLFRRKSLLWFFSSLLVLLRLPEAFTPSIFGMKLYCFGCLDVIFWPVFIIVLACFQASFLASRGEKKGIERAKTSLFN